MRGLVTLALRPHQVSAMSVPSSPSTCRVMAKTCKVPATHTSPRVSYIFLTSIHVSAGNAVAAPVKQGNICSFMLAAMWQLLTDA